MTYPLSERLSQALAATPAKPDDEINFEDLRRAVAEGFGNASRCACDLIPSRTGAIRFGVVILHLTKLVPHDSVVRDIFTLGHLAKLLARLNLLTEEDAYKVAGLPNPLFDRESQADRNLYFQEHKGFPIDGSVWHQVEAKKIMESEKQVLVIHGHS